MRSIRCLTSHEWKAYQELRLRALAGAPYGFGTTLAKASAYYDAF